MPLIEHPQSELRLSKNLNIQLLFDGLNKSQYLHLNKVFKANTPLQLQTHYYYNYFNCYFSPGILKRGYVLYPLFIVILDIFLDLPIMIVVQWNHVTDMMSNRVFLYSAPTRVRSMAVQDGLRARHVTILAISIVWRIATHSTNQPF